ncbi:calcium-binding protein [Microvirga yunnanensis]|uniref:calcium-binding protein n=1 Tax=Microvirga yunnanensis TaxID=2953740 RepID=UPI0021C816C7|nr:calcium-binding protein [Microvirga sp. HBU65207]
MTFKIWGTENTINHKIGVDYDAITMLPGGGYVVTWRENNKIAFQLYDGNGTTDNVTRFVEASGAGLTQQFSDVFAFDAEGGFAITWTEGNGTTGRTLKNQKFNFDGSANGAASTLNSVTMNDGAQTSPDFFAGQWATTYIQLIGPTKTVRLVQNGLEVDVATGSVDRPDVAYIGGEKHVVSYQTDANGKVSFRVVNDGTLETQVTLDGVRADVIGLKDPTTGLPNGKFAVIVDKGAAGTEARIYNSADVSANPAIINLGGTKANNTLYDYASGTALKNGGLAVAYIAADGTDLGDVYVRVIDANGVPGNPIKINARASMENGSQRDPMISEMADGRLSVSWIDPSISDGSAPSIVSSTIVDARVAKIDVKGTSHDDIYAPSEFAKDTLNGKGGFDTLTFNGTTTGGVAVDLVAGNGSAGDAAEDTYTSFEKVIGSSFNDTLTGGAGHVLVGGAGNDTYNVSATDTVIDESGGGTDQVFSSATYTLSAGIENLFGTGDAAIDLTGNGSGNIIGGNEAANRITGLAGDDALYGNGGNDILDAGDGNDALDGGAGDDALAGGTGNDVLYGRDGNDTLNGDDGNDILDGGAGNDALNGGNGADALSGGDGVDNLVGGAGDDVLNGNGGADVMNGGDGNDVYYIDDLGDQVIDGAGVDTVYIAVNGYDLNRLGAIENLTGIGTASITLTGNASNNLLTGNDGANILMGGAGNDVLSGGAGKDRLHGGLGADVLDGGSQADIFVFDTNPKTKGNADRIVNYAKEDAIYIDDKYFKVGPKGSLAKPKAMASKYFYAGTKAHDADDRIIYNKKTGGLYYDSDGTGSQKAVLFATITNKLKIDYHEFFVI